MGLFSLFESKSSSSQQTDNVDGRVVGGDASSNISAANNSGTLNITALDGGAISQSMALAFAGVEGAQSLAAQTIDQNADLLKNVVTATREGQDQFAAALENVKTADTRMLAFGALAVLGFVALKVWGK